MKTKGSVNFQLSFPVITYVDGSYDIVKAEKELCVCNMDFIKHFLEDKPKYLILDHDGWLYEMSDIHRLGYSNLFFGFSLATGGKTYYADIYLKKVANLTMVELKEWGGRILIAQKKAFAGTVDRFNSLNSQLKNLEERNKIIELIFLIVAGKGG